MSRLVVPFRLEVHGHLGGIRQLVWTQLTIELLVSLVVADGSTVRLTLGDSFFPIVPLGATRTIRFHTLLPLLD
jgi:hypothetical protein